MKGLYQKSLVVQYMIDNSINFNPQDIDLLPTFKVASVDYFVEEELIGLVEITEAQMLALKTDVETNQSLDTSVDQETIVSASDPNVILRDAEVMNISKKRYIGHIYTDPDTGLDVEIDPYRGGAILATPPTSTLPTAPTMVVSNITTNGFTLTMSGSTDPDGTVDGYNVYIDGPLDSTHTTNVAVITGLTSSTSYFVVVKAYDNDGNESFYGPYATVVTLQLP